MDSVSPSTFAPYATYCDSEKGIQEFVDLSEVSYGLAQQLLFRHPKNTLPPSSFQLPERPWLVGSYSQGDQEVAAIEEMCAWLTLDQYAQRTGQDRAMVNQQAAGGELDPMSTHPESGERLVLWPAERRGDAELPQPGKNKYRVAIRTTLTLPGPTLDPADVDSFDQVQREYLRAAHALGKADEISKRAAAVLYRAAFLAQWTVFEVFLRQTTEEMLRRHASVLGHGARGRQSLSYAELLEMSAGLSSIEDLRASIVEAEIEDLRGAGRSVHGLLNFLKGEFHFDRDPYEAFYVWNGERSVVTFSSLMDLKDLRNSLVHEYQRTIVPTVASRPDIDETTYGRARLALRALAFSVSDSIVNVRYRFQ